jgi:hypothetical protein
MVTVAMFASSDMSRKVRLAQLTCFVNDLRMCERGKREVTGYTFVI